MKDKASKLLRSQSSQALMGCDRNLDEESHPSYRAQRIQCQYPGEMYLDTPSEVLTPVLVDQYKSNTR